MLKEAKFKLDFCLEFFRFAYVIIDNNCYFTGLKGLGGTVNKAEDIIQTILDKESRSIESLNFFDIWTCRQYNFLFPGKWRAKQLKIKRNHGHWGFCVEAWDDVELSETVREIFKEYIGINLKTIYSSVLSNIDGLIVVSNEDHDMLFVHPDGTLAFEGKYSDVYDFHHKDFLWVCKDYEYCFKINRQGERLSEPISIEDFRNGKFE
jgi:hypothetical protein